MTETQNKIIGEIYKAIQQLGGDSTILSYIGSIGDTLSDEDVLAELQAYNLAGGQKVTLMPQQVFLSRRNLLTLLSKLDRTKAGNTSACTLIKGDYVHDKYPQTARQIAVTALEDDEYYTTRQPGEVHPTDERNIAAAGGKAYEVELAAGDKVVFKEKQSPEQINWGSNDDPNNLLVVGQTYTLQDIEVHSWHTKLMLVEFPGKKFNSITFEKA